jgi:hypothetical protein
MQISTGGDNTMTNWYDRIGNEIKMLVPVDHGQYVAIVGTVYAGYRYKDGIVSMHGEDGTDYHCYVESWTLQKTEKTLPDLLTNADKIRNMTDQELNTFLWKWKINSISGFITGGGAKLAKLMDGEEQLLWLQEESGKSEPAEVLPLDREELK